MAQQTMIKRKTLFQSKTTFALFCAILFLSAQFCCAQNANIQTGADQTQLYLPLLKGKNVGMVVNQTSVIGSKNVSSVDSLLKRGIKIKRVFGPEHGFRGNASNGAKVGDEVDPKTGINIVSLYGAKRKPSKSDLDSVDVMVFDIQDVGCRFYTNINTLGDVMEACAEFGKELIILDRPNPNAYVDGPVLDMKLKSGVGKYPIPILHGMTIGEFAKMINGQCWLPNNAQCKIRVIPVKNYKHDMAYTLPVNPSPNLNTQQSVLLYPSLCLFEGTTVSQGRGTYMPFTVLGSPYLKGTYDFTFTPVSIPGKSETPLYQNQVCYGLDLRNYNTETLRKSGKINLKWIMDLFNAYPDKAKFFDRKQSKQIGNIDFLAGVSAFKEQISAGKTEQEIRQSWEPGLSEYKLMRKKYLLYK
ncbi:MAG: exo-beta-N-acetylmuramidase NamZ domain-containing protein [Mucilaginibacter sp.]|uniref:exo-beta-N-acetylmuramidase NamZ family protein n=1 Tax=Mucilaginibacter sp. TaxID=1882438 RepID=UPI0034E52AE0